MNKIVQQRWNPNEGIFLSDLKVLPIPDSIVKYVERIAEKEGAPKGLNILINMAKSLMKMLCLQE